MVCFFLFFYLVVPRYSYLVFFFFNDPAPPEFSPLSLPAPLPFSGHRRIYYGDRRPHPAPAVSGDDPPGRPGVRRAWLRHRAGGGTSRGHLSWPGHLCAGRGDTG